MIGAVHAIVGACIGSFFRSKSSAFAAGMASHVAADALPHKDFDPIVEAPLLIGAMTAIAAWRGAESPEFWGAVGSVSPDFEHGLEAIGLTQPDQKVFPTHISNGKCHGPKSNERLSQLLIAAAALAIMALKSGKHCDSPGKQLDNFDAARHIEKPSASIFTGR